MLEVTNTTTSMEIQTLDVTNETKFTTMVVSIDLFLKLLSVVNLEWPTFINVNGTLSLITQTGITINIMNDTTNKIRPIDGSNARIITTDIIRFIHLNN